MAQSPADLLEPGRPLTLASVADGAQGLGIAEAAYEASVAYAREREAFGSKIGEFQGIQYKIADMKTRIEAARLLTYNAALAKERSKVTGERYTLQASMAKLFASETAMFCAHAAVQMFGGRGVMHGEIVESLYREIRALRIYEGATEVQKLIVARELLKSR